MGAIKSVSEAIRSVTDAVVYFFKRHDKGVSVREKDTAVRRAQELEALDLEALAPIFSIAYHHLLRRSFRVLPSSANHNTDTGEREDHQPD